MIFSVCNCFACLFSCGGACRRCGRQFCAPCIERHRCRRPGPYDEVECMESSLRRRRRFILAWHCLPSGEGNNNMMMDCPHCARLYAVFFHPPQLYHPPMCVVCSENEHLASAAAAALFPHAGEGCNLSVWNCGAVGPEDVPATRVAFCEWWPAIHPCILIARGEV